MTAGKQRPGKGGAGEKERGRSLKTRVKTARKRSLSSTLWLERQLNDPYVAQARREGWRSRAAYKLIEIDERFKLLRPGLRVLDLGAAPGGWAQVVAVISDMAANATGHRKTDHLKIVALAELAADFACEVLAPGGFFLAKVLQGGTENELLARLKRDFATVRHLKPAASRADSAELYVLATGFRGGQISVESPSPAP
jgi:23S rRNA (uridine2552-2'-O)-methyltransferase